MLRQYLRQITVDILASNTMFSSLFFIRLKLHEACSMFHVTQFASIYIFFRIRQSVKILYERLYFTDIFYSRQVKHCAIFPRIGNQSGILLLLSPIKMFFCISSKFLAAFFLAHFLCSTFSARNGDLNS